MCTNLSLQAYVGHAQRAVYLMSLVNILNGTFIANLDDATIVNLFLFGDKNLPENVNLLLFEMAQTFIINTKRFNDRLPQ